MRSTAWQVGNDPFFMLMVLLLVPSTCWWLTRTRFSSRPIRGLAVTLVGLYALFATFVFPWGMFTIYLCWFPLLAWLAACVVVFTRPFQPVAVPPDKIKSRRRIWVFFTGLILLLDASLIKGWLPPAERIELAFPLKGGNYYILQGGRSFWINYHYGKEAEYRYAMDITQVDAFGRRANGLLPQSMQAYWIYGGTVYSPCSGQVSAVVDGWNDSPISTSDADEPGGNQISIDCGDAMIWLEHLLIGSIDLTVGQQVQVGEPIALVGNSGASSEPHLHIHAWAKSSGNRKECLAITFDRRFLVRNTLFRAP